jgi:energy-coupling factor transporter ATP-binding protein EcfA2
MIRLDHVTYTYPDSPTPAIADVSLEIAEGEFLLVTGPSGSGKSTLLRCLNGLVPHFYGGTLAGQVSILGHDPVAEGPAAMSQLVGLVFQNPEAQCVATTVEEELAFAMENHGLDEATMRQRIEQVLMHLGMSHLRGRRLETLSGGERQRLAIGAVLTLQPRLLVLDEPTSQLDPQGAEEVLHALLRLNRDLGLTVVLSEHRLERVCGHADRLLYLPGPGQPPLLGPPRDVLAQMDLVPPLVALAKALGWQPLPLTVKEARGFLAPADSRDQGPGTRVPEEACWPLVPCPWPLESTPTPVRPPSPAAIQVSGLSFSYNSHPALRGVSLEVGFGEVVALMGANGAGKTTLLKHLVGLLRPREGQVEVCGLDTRRVPLERLIEHVGYVPQNPDMLLFADTVAGELDFTLRQHGRPAGDYGPLPHLLGLEEHLQRYPRDLSVGERQRVALAAVLVANPEVILLDEPTRGLDYGQKEALVGFLLAQRAQGRAVLLATHDVELAARCADRVVILGAGAVLVEGPIRQVMTAWPAFSSQVNRLYRGPRYLTVEDVLSAQQRPSHA